MTVVSFINQKGGCGLAATTCHFAYWLHQKGKEVAVIDSDAQQSVSRWLTGMESVIQCFVMHDPDQLMEDIPKVTASFDYILVDGSAGITEATRCILLRSDVVIVPVQPTGLDLSSANDAIRLVKQAQSVRGGLPKFHILLNRVVRGTRLYSEAVQFLQDKHMLKTVIPQRQAIADCFGQKSVVWTLPGNESAKEAAKEFEALCQEIMEVVTP
ncbi:MAG: AAA family ATPase [Iphinoe sp. HA4291-MV1]|nr:AAA family ATPase [Iphinoe sp. HA4291-MV1]